MTTPIPPSLGNLTNLRRLELSAYRFTGSIPSSLGNLINLEYLDRCSECSGGPFSSGHGVPVPFRMTSRDGLAESGRPPGAPRGPCASST